LLEPSLTVPPNPEIKQEAVKETSQLDETQSSCGNALVKYRTCESKKIKLESDCSLEIKYFTSKQELTSQGQADDFVSDDISRKLHQNVGNLVSI